MQKKLLSSFRLELSVATLYPVICAAALLSSVSSDTTHELPETAHLKGHLQEGTASVFSFQSSLIPWLDRDERRCARSAPGVPESFCLSSFSVVSSLSSCSCL